MDSSSTRRQPTRQRLFEAAVTLIAEQGFSATTVDEIAERAGVAKGTVYYNFASKTVLFEELLRHGIELLTTALRGAADRVRGQGGGPLEALDALVRAGLDFMSRDPALTRLYMAEAWRVNRPWQTTLTVVRQQALSVIEQVLREGIATGDLAAETDVQLTASALFGMMLVAALDGQSARPERSVEEVHAAVSRLLPGLVGGTLARGARS